MHVDMVNKQWWVGVRLDGGRDVFESMTAPTRDTHGHIYKLCIGPHSSEEAAEYMAGPGYSQPWCLTPNDAERLVTKLKKV